MAQAREDIPRSGVVLATLEPRAELPRWKQQIHVVGADEILCEVDDRVFERYLAVVVSGLLRDVAHKLCDLDVVLELLFERAEHHLALRGLKAVDHGRHRTFDVILGELHQLLVNEVVVRHKVRGVVHVRPFLVVVDPLLTVVGSLLVESEVDRFAVLVVDPAKAELVILNVLEIFFSLFGGARAQALVILGLPALPTVRAVLPLDVLRQGEEALLVLAVLVTLTVLPNLNNGRDEFLQEAVHLHQ
mmetsp:Transcript_34586/g.95274  ORF Transcript_34586/g.95274 Transcript_34586/m.95274 type:complete len:246 (+) Transcript_34586:2179-2916(+)